jgi:hypothetical protein
MFPTILKLAWPLAQSLFVKRVAGSAANYLNQRRENRLLPDSPPVTEPVLAGEPLQCPVPVIIGFSAWDVFWFTLSGVIFGSAMGFITTYVVRHRKKAESFP